MKVAQDVLEGVTGTIARRCTHWWRSWPCAKCREAAADATSFLHAMGYLAPEQRQVQEVVSSAEADDLYNFFVEAEDLRGRGRHGREPRRDQPASGTVRFSQVTVHRHNRKGSRMMKVVKVKREDLILRIKENRERHREVFDQAQLVYRSKMIEELDRMIEDAKQGHKIRRMFALPEPEDHTDDYDRILDMLEMHTEPIVEIDEREFAQYVRDDWGWKAAWANSTASYVASAYGASR